MSDAPEPLHAARRDVLFQEIDAAGVVFYARVFDWFHDAWLALLAARGVDVPGALATRAWGAPLAHAEADYRVPMRFGDAVVVAVDAVELGATSARVRYRVHAAGDTARVHATGATVHVFVDAASGRPCPMPEAVRAALSA